MNKKNKTIAASILVIGLVFFVTYKYIISSGERTIETEKSEFKVTSKEILNEFETDTAATSKYLDKAIEIKGVITQNEGEQIILDGIIICSMKKQDTLANQDHRVTIKGRFLGYDDLMGELKLDECTIVK